jgi:hypothetical protein
MQSGRLYDRKFDWGVYSSLIDRWMGSGRLYSDHGRGVLPLCNKTCCAIGPFWQRSLNMLRFWIFYLFIFGSFLFKIRL